MDRLDVEVLGDIDDQPLRFAAAAAASRTRKITASEFRALIVPFVAPNNADSDLSLDLFDELQYSLRDEELSDDDAMFALATVFRQCTHPWKERILQRFFRRIAGAVDAATVIDLGVRMSTPSFEGPVVWSIIAAGRERSLDRALVYTEKAIARISRPSYRAAARASNLHGLEGHEQEEAWKVLTADLGGAPAAFDPSELALLLGALPDTLHERAMQDLLPESLPDGRPDLFTSRSWVDDIKPLILCLDPSRLEQLHSLAPGVDSATSKATLLSCIATRLSMLGQFDEALSIIKKVTRPNVAAIEIREAVDTMSEKNIEQLITWACAELPYPIYREERTCLWAAVGRRLCRFSNEGLLRIVEEWLNRRPTRGEMLVDIPTYVPALINACGTSLARELLSTVNPRNNFGGT